MHRVFEFYLFDDDRNQTISLSLLLFSPIDFSHYSLISRLKTLFIAFQALTTVCLLSFFLSFFPHHHLPPNSHRGNTRNQD